MLVAGGIGVAAELDVVIPPVVPVLPELPVFPLFPLLTTFEARLLINQRDMKPPVPQISVLSPVQGKLQDVCFVAVAT
jgi:hypothetical protein